MLSAGPQAPVIGVCREHGISEGTYYEWRDVALAAAERGLDDLPTQESGPAVEKVPA